MQTEAEETAMPPREPTISGTARAAAPGVPDEQPLSRTLDALVHLVEEQSPGMLCSILLLDSGRLRYGSGPGLPRAYNEAIDGLAIGPREGSCGTAAYRGETVIVRDVVSDPLWANYRDLAAEHGLRAAWSTPVRGRRGEVLGTFAMYYREPRSPTAGDLRLIDSAAQIAASMIERHRVEEEREKLLRSEEAARRELEQARAEAEEANHAKSQFLATMSHELRTPINAIVGYTELLDLGIAGTVNEEQQAQLERIRVSSRHLLTLINDVLDLAKVESGRMRVKRERVPLRRAVLQAIAIVENQADRRQLELRDEASGAREIAFTGDEDRVRQILANLLSNAVKFTEPGGHVHVGYRVADEPADGARPAGEGPWLVVEVEDSGIGIPADRLRSIFEPFVQVDSRLTREHGGTGLGLTISRNLARLMEGDLTVRSRLDDGSCFALWLPLAP